MQKWPKNLDPNQLAKRIVDEATNNAPAQPESTKNKAAQELGRLGGLKGGKARARMLSQERRSEIAKLAASSRWNKKQNMEFSMVFNWSKKLTKSDAQQDTMGAKMPFLRFTKQKIPYNHKTWFRNEFFGKLTWKQSVSRFGKPIEEVKVPFHVVILGKDLGTREMLVDHAPSRAENHSAPTTHLHYDNVTRQALESQNLDGHSIVVECADGIYSLTVL